MDDFMSQIPPFLHHDMFLDDYVLHHMDHDIHGHFPRFDLPYMEVSMSNQLHDHHQVSNEESMGMEKKYSNPLADSVSQNWPNSSSLSMDGLDDQIPSKSVGPIPVPSSTSNATSYNDILHLDQAIEALRKTRNPRFPKPEEEHEVMTRAILAVLSNPSSSSSPNPSSPALLASQSVSSPSSSTTFRTRNFSQQKLDDEIYNGHIASTSSQLHHTISERRRREKLNENFQTLRSLLPPGTKRDKASVLSTSVDRLTSLKSQILELTTKNHNLEMELSLRLSPNLLQRVDEKLIRNDEVNVRISNAVESSSSSLGLKMINMQVSSRRDSCLLDTTIRVLELLEQTRNVGLVSLDTKTLKIGLNSMNMLIFRLNIIDKDGKWDEVSFRDAVRKAVAELAVISP